MWFTNSVQLLRVAWVEGTPPGTRTPSETFVEWWKCVSTRKQVCELAMTTWIRQPFRSTPCHCLSFDPGTVLLPYGAVGFVI